MNKNNIHVLLVDDDEDDYVITNDLFAEIKHNTYTVTWVDTVDKALSEMFETKYDICLLDYNLGSDTGIEVMQRALNEGCKLPIVILTGQDDHNIDMQAMELGASDFLIKHQINSALLERSVRYAIDRKRAEEQILFLAYYDQLTNLPNRVLFLDHLTLALSAAKRYNRYVALMFLDLDDFKKVNDTSGHDVGDQLLQEVAGRLLSCIRKSDIVARNSISNQVDIIARLGGDEFTICLTEIKEVENASKVAERILKALADPFFLDNHQFHVTSSIGISVFPFDGEDPQTLLKHADMAMYHAKEKGRNNFQYFKSEINSSALKRLEVEQDLRKAVDDNEFLLHYQPVIDIQTGSITGTEALLRWRHAERGLVMPDEILSIVEENGLIKQIGERVIHEACKQYATWIKQGIKPVPISINFSLKQFEHDNPADLLSGILHEFALAGDTLIIEITENTFMDNPQLMIHKLNKIREVGIKICIDDFGMGCSSFEYLKLMPVDYLKIGRSFSENLPEGEADAAVVPAIIAMGHLLNAGVTVKWVENMEQVRFLKEHNCDGIQGFLVSEPVDGETIGEILKKEQTDERIGNKVLL